MLTGSIFMGVGVLSLAYFIGYALIIDLNNVFTFFWLVLGVGCLLGGGWLRYMYLKGHFVSKSFSIAALSVGAIVLLFVGVMVGLLLHDAYQKPEPNADYMIILGARVNGRAISTNLKYRLEAAQEYLSENTDTIAVVSGGQGAGEDLSEAEAMQKYLLEHGISVDRILVEDQSVNTDQNIRNSLEIIQQHRKEEGSGRESGRIVLVSNGFHLYRATRIARKQLSAMQEKTDILIEGLGSRTKPYTLPNSYVREIVAVLKYKACGQI